MNYRDLVEQLEAADFFDFAEKSEAATIKHDVVHCQYKHLFPEALGRSFFADAEDLAEGGVFDFVATIAPRLAHLGVHLPVAEVQLRPVKQRDPATGGVIEVTRTKLRLDDSIPDPAGIKCLRPVNEDLPESGDYYRVTIGARTREIWNSEMDGEQMWEAGMCHTFILINELLDDAGTNERLYGMYGGNDGQAIFLTSKQFELIRECDDIEDRDKPWAAYVVK